MTQAPCITPATEHQLVESLDRLENAQALTADQCETIGRGFVYCNAVIHLAEFLLGAFRAGSEPVTRSYRYEDVHDCFRKCDLNKLLRIVNELRDEEATIVDCDPWSCIHRWLAIDAIRINVLALDEHRTPILRGPADNASEIFEDVLRFHHDVAVFRQRASSVREAFQRWWRGWCDNLAGFLNSTLRNPVPLTAESCVAKALANSLSAKAVVYLTSKRNIQFQQAVGQANDPLPLPTGPPPDWRQTIAMKLHAADLLKQAINLDKQECQMLAALLAWLDEHDLTGRLDADLPVLRKVAKNGGPQDLAELELLLDAWNTLTNVLRTRGWKATPSLPRMVDDIFECNTSDLRSLGSNGGSFRAWRTKALRFGMGA